MSDVRYAYYIHFGCPAEAPSSIRALVLDEKRDPVNSELGPISEDVYHILDRLFDLAKHVLSIWVHLAIVKGEGMLLRSCEALKM